MFGVLKQHDRTLNLGELFFQCHIMNVRESCMIYNNKKKESLCSLNGLTDKVILMRDGKHSSAFFELSSCICDRDSTGQEVIANFALSL